MFKKEESPSKCLKLVLSGYTREEFILNKQQTLLGNTEHADISITKDDLFPYHALFLLKEAEYGKVLNLTGHQNIFINGQPLETNSFFSTGDQIQIAILRFQVEEHLLRPEEACDLPTFQEETVSEILPPLPHESLIEGLTLIDDDYCDIHFAENDFQTASVLDGFVPPQAELDYIDEQNNESELVDIVAPKDEYALQVSTLSRGVVISVDYFPLKKDQELYLSNKNGRQNISFPLFDQEEKVPFAQIRQGEIYLKTIKDFQHFLFEDKSFISQDQSDQFHLVQDKCFYYQYKTVQLAVEIVKAPARLNKAPFFLLEQGLTKQLAKPFSALMGIMLLLLLVDTHQEPPPKKISVIYRKAVEAPKVSHQKSSANPSKQEKDLGTKQNKQPKKQTKVAKSAPPKAKKKVQKSKPIAKKAVSKKAAPKKPKVKAYKFKIKKSVANLFNESSSPAPTVETAKRSLANLAAAAPSSAASAEGLKKASVEVGSLGQEQRGTHAASSGAQGLASKRGIDTTYANTKTVILGSIDPELLRKILREHLPQFRHCYQRELELNEAVKGVVDLNFRIMGSGQVSRVDIKTKTSSFSRKGTDCMAKVLHIIDFPKPKGGGLVDVKQPLNFLSERNRI